MACSLGGIVACGLTHTAVTPLDVVKCNMQTDPKNYTGIAQVGLCVGLCCCAARVGDVGLQGAWGGSDGGVEHGGSRWLHDRAQSACWGRGRAQLFEACHTMH